MKPFLFPGLPLILLTSVVARADPAPAPPLPTVALHFAWPERLRVQLETARSVEKTSGSAEKSASTCRAEIDRQDDGGYLFHWDTGNFDNVPLGLLPPDFLVSDQGAFADLADVGGYLAQAAQRLSSLTDEASLQAIKLSAASDVRRDWMLLVTNWAGRSLEPGRTYEEDASGPTPTDGTPAAHYRKHLRLDRGTPCAAGETEDRCVVLVVRSEAHPMDRSGAPASRPPIQIEDETTLVTEPASLLPHRITTREWLSIELPGGAKHVKSETTREWRYLPLTAPAPGPDLP